MSMNVVALICARGGSKGLPGKNIRPLAGKPLIAWSILQAKAVARVRRVIVSTDSDAIAAASVAAGAEVPFMRPAELAQDKSPEWLAWRHALDFLKAEEGSYPEVLLVVPATAPLRAVEDIERCLDLFEKKGADVVLTVSASSRNPWFNMVRVKDDGFITLVNSPDPPIRRRQDAPVVYDLTPVAYVTSPDFVMSSNGIFEGRVAHVLVPPERAVDIDTALDFRIAECLFDGGKPVPWKP